MLLLLGRGGCGRCSRRRGVAATCGDHDGHLHGDVGRVMVVVVVVRVVVLRGGRHHGRRMRLVVVVVVRVGVVVGVMVVMILVVVAVVHHDAGRGGQGARQPVRDHLLEGQLFSEFEINCSRFLVALFNLQLLLSCSFSSDSSLSVARDPRDT